MKRVLLFVLLALSFTFLTGCFDDIYISDGEISVVYDNIRYEGTSLFVDVYITNGLDNDEEVGYMEFDIYSSDDVLYMAGAGFDIDETIPSDDYIFIELEFGATFVFVSEADIEAAGYDLDESVLYFYID